MVLGVNVAMLVSNSRGRFCPGGFCRAAEGEGCLEFSGLSCWLSVATMGHVEHCLTGLGGGPQ
jgi:hypothetical protein